MDYNLLQSNIEDVLAKNYRFPTLCYGANIHLVLDSRKAAVFSETPILKSIPMKGKLCKGWNILPMGGSRKQTTILVSSPSDPKYLNYMGPCRAAYITTLGINDMAGRYGSNIHCLSAKRHTIKAIDSAKQVKVIKNSIKHMSTIIENSSSAYTHTNEICNKATKELSKEYLALFPISCIKIHDIHNTIINNASKNKIVKLLDIFANIPLTLVGPFGTMKYKYQATKCGCGVYETDTPSNVIHYMSIPGYWPRSVYFIQLIYSQIHLAMKIANMPEVADKIINEFPEELLTKALILMDNESIEEVKNKFVKLMISMPYQLADGINLTTIETLYFWLELMEDRNIFKKYFKSIITNIGNLNFKRATANYFGATVSISARTLRYIKDIEY
jgi:hypothetical protein